MRSTAGKRRNEHSLSRPQSSRLIVYPPCKINLGLRILRRRPDQYHDLETVFVPAPVHDILELLPVQDKGKTTIQSFTQSGIVIEGDVQTNLCIKAWQVLKRDIPNLPEVRIHLHKIIPTGAGLGGGSSDAAYTLRALNQLFGLGLDQHQLTAYAAELGSDCPFFIQDQSCYATGRGEILEPIQTDLSAYQLLIVHPGIHIHTGKAFQQIRPAVPEKNIRDILAGPAMSWKATLINDFEGPVFNDHPEIAKIKAQMYAAGAVYASLSGSGSAVYALFPKDIQVALQWPEKYFVRLVPAQ